MIKYDDLKPGMVFKNYRKLCEFIGDKPKGGDSKKAHLASIEKQYELIKSEEGNSIIIGDKITCTNLEFSYGGYSKHIQPLIVILLYSKYLSLGNDRITMSPKQLAFEIGMHNSDYKEFRNKKTTLASEMNIPIMDVSSMYGMGDSKIVYNIKTSLEDMKKRGIIKLTPVMMQVFMGNNKRKNREIRSKSEIQRIHAVKKQVLMKYGASKEHVLNLNGKSSAYREDLKDAMNIEFKTDNILYNYDAYKISLNKDLLFDEELMFKLMETKEYHKQSLNEHMVEMYKLYYIKGNKKAIDRLEFQIEELDHYRIGDYQYQSSEHYIINGHTLIDRLIKINSP